MKLFSFLSRSILTEKVPTLSKLAYDRAKAIMASNKKKKIDMVIQLLKVNTKITKNMEHNGKSSSVTVDNDRITRFNEGVSETIDCIDAQNKEKSIAVMNGNGCQKLKSVDVDDGDENENVNNNRGDCGESFSGEAEIEHKYEFKPELCVESIPESDKDDADDDDEHFYVVGKKLVLMK